MLFTLEKWRNVNCKAPWSDHDENNTLVHEAQCRNIDELFEIRTKWNIMEYNSKNLIRRVAAKFVPHFLTGVLKNSPNKFKRQDNVHLLIRLQRCCPRSHRSTLRESIRKKRADLWRANDWFLRHDNAPALSVTQFLTKNGMAKNLLRSGFWSTGLLWFIIVPLT